MRIVRVADQVLVFDGTGRLVDDVLPEVVEASEQLSDLYRRGEFVGLYPMTVQRQRESESTASCNHND
jgi:hypothetical protein